jgi:hypothetical protein
VELDDLDRQQPTRAAPGASGSRAPAVIAFGAGACIALIVWAMQDKLEASAQPQWLVLSVGLFGWVGTRLRALGEAFFSGRQRTHGVDEARRTSRVVLLLAWALVSLLCAGAVAGFVDAVGPTGTPRGLVGSGATFGFGLSVLVAIVREWRR